MLQEVRDYWLPLMLLVVVLLLAAFLFLFVIAAPYALEFLPPYQLLELYANDTTVRRVSLAASVGLVVTALLFFRPNSAILGRKSSAKKAPHDTMAGA